MSLLEASNIDAPVGFGPSSVDGGSVGMQGRRRRSLTPAQRAAKRLLDMATASLVFLIIAPVLIAICGLIRLDSPGPVLFRQSRTGLNGKTFHIYKFRTMSTLENGERVVQACRGDKRITRVGAILRRLSLDELPQLLNVLKGDMSLVGPRPHALAHDFEYGQAISGYAARHDVKPGITGWAQVNGWRGATPELHLMIKRVEHDLWYIDHWSMWLDLRIILLTPLTVASARNAY